MQKTINKTRDKKATGDDDVHGDVLKLLGEDGHSIETQLINNIYESGKWPSIFNEATRSAVKKPKATKCSNHCTISLIAYTAKTVARICRRRIERKTEDILGAHRFGFRRRKGNRNANGMLRIILG